MYLRNYSTSLGRQMSGPTPSPKVGFNNFGTSLPVTPSQHNFATNFDSLFKPNSFVASSPKQSRKPNEQSVTEVSRSPSFSQSSASPGHYRPKKQVFDFETTSMFGHGGQKGLDSSRDENDFVGLSQASVHYNAGNSNSTTESFIAQVTRDLAKMTAAEKNLSDTSSARPFMDSSFSSLFKS